MRHLYFSWLLDELAEIAGEGAVKKIAEAYGGRQWVVPLEPTPTLCALIGTEAAIRICELRGGSEIHVPTLARVRQRRAQNAKRLDIQTSQKDTAELARKYGLTKRRIRQIKTEWRDPRLR